MATPPLSSFRDSAPARSAPAARPSRRGAICRAASLLLLGTACFEVARAQAPAEELIALINAHRSEPQHCEGRQMPAVAPLAHEPVLERVDPGGGAAALQQDLKSRGYRASRLQLLTLTGVSDARSAMRLLEQRYCRLLSSTSFAEIGVAREGRSWRLVLAQPLLDADLGTWQQAGREVLERVNVARSRPRRCGGTHFEAAPPLRWNDRLAAAARAHSVDMAKRSYLSHDTPEGVRPAERVERQGYRWRRVGENIASGQGSPDKVVAAWLTSPVHCRNIMAPGFAEMGAAFAMEPGSEHGIYWTQVFGTAL